MSIEDRLDREPAVGWRPEPGDQVVGTIVEISEAPGTDWGPYPVITIDKADGTGEVAVHAFHSVLKNEIESKQPTEGDTIGIRYLGKQQGAKQSYEGYRVVLERVTPRAAGTPAAPAPVPAAASAPASAPAPSNASWADEEPF